jgi:hypothetical protein
MLIAMSSGDISVDGVDDSGSDIIINITDSEGREHEITYEETSSGYRLTEHKTTDHGHSESYDLDDDDELDQMTNEIVDTALQVDKAANEYIEDNYGNVDYS